MACVEDFSLQINAARREAQDRALASHGPGELSANNPCTLYVQELQV